MVRTVGRVDEHLDTSKVKREPAEIVLEIVATVIVTDQLHFGKHSQNDLEDTALALGIWLQTDYVDDAMGAGEE